MMLSRLFLRRHLPEPQFGPSLFLGLVAIFALVVQIKPAVGLAGLGTTALVAAMLIELNRVRIWESYRTAYKKRKALHSPWNEPRRIYYTLNVAFLWPLVAMFGVLCLVAAYCLA